MIEASRSVLNRYIPDIYLYSDVYKGEDSGKCVYVLTKLHIQLISAQVTGLRVKSTGGVYDGCHALRRSDIKTWCTARRHRPSSIKVASDRNTKGWMRRQAASSSSLTLDGPR